MSERKYRPLIWLVSLLVILAMVLTACGGQPTTAPTQPAGGQPATQPPQWRRTTRKEVHHRHLEPLRR